MLPYEDSAQKYDDYLLDKNHTVGGSKAKFLSETLGYNEGAGAKLHAAISEAINGKNQMKSLQLNMKLRQRFILQLKAMMANITLQTLQLSFKKRQREDYVENHYHCSKKEIISMRLILELFDCVILIKPFENLKVGMKGAIVEKYNDHDFEVEFFDDNGETIDVYTISADYLEVYWKASEHK